MGIVLKSFIVDLNIYGNLVLHNIYKCCDDLTHSKTVLYLFHFVKVLFQICGANILFRLRKIPFILFLVYMKIIFLNSLNNFYEFLEKFVLVRFTI